MSNDMTEARAGKARAVKERKRTIAEEAEAVLADNSVNDELKRKLRYCLDEIRKGRDAGLVDRRNHLLAEARRRLR